jgi:His Kinase A (phospho-acceptor) domain
MTSPARQKLYLKMSGGIFLLHLCVAALAKPSFHLTLFGDSLACLFLLLAILSSLENARDGAGVLPLFWKLMCTGLFLLLLSETYWLYYDSLKRFSSPSPVLGDSFFLLAHIFFLFAFALRPHSSTAGGNLSLRWIDFALLTCWWFTLYAYFCLPWQTMVQDFPNYNPGYYLLALILHLVIIGGLLVLWIRNQGVWRTFYGHLAVTFLVIASGNLLLSVAIDRGLYYAGSFFDTPFFLALFWLSYVASLGPTLVPRDDSQVSRELKQGIWTARVAVCAILSLPVLAFAVLYSKNLPSEIFAFRLRVIFGAMLCLGALLFWKLSLLSRQLVHLVSLTSASIENLRSVQARVSHSQKLSALGRLAAGATHEISNPLTAILGYSELLADISTLSADDRECAVAIQQHVHHAQAAVNSLRVTLRGPGTQHPILSDKPDTP